MSNRLVQKSFRLPAKAVQIVEDEVQKNLGINFNEYIKVFIIQKAEEISSASNELFSDILLARQDYKNGQGVLLKNKKDIKEYVSKNLGSTYV